MWFNWRWIPFDFVKREYVQRGVYEAAIKEVELLRKGVRSGEETIVKLTQDLACKEQELKIIVEQFRKKESDKKFK